MERSPSSERPAIVRGDDGQESVRDGLGLDGEWKHQGFCEGVYRCEPAGASMLLFDVPILARP